MYDDFFFVGLMVSITRLFLFIYKMHIFPWMTCKFTFFL